MWGQQPQQTTQGMGQTYQGGYSGYMQQQPQAQPFGGAQTGFNQNTYGQQQNKPLYGAYSGSQIGASYSAASNTNVPQYYAKPIEQTTLTIGVQFNNKQETIDHGTQAKSPSSAPGIFNNIRIEPKYLHHSNQMLKVLDMMAMQAQQPQPSFEVMAQQEFQQNSGKYVHAQKVTGGGAQQQTFTGMAGQQTPGFGGMQQQQQQQTPWGQPQQQQQKPLFGGMGTQTTTPAFGQGPQTPAFGAQQAPFGQQTGLMQKPLFGQPTQQVGGNLGGGIGSGIKPTFGGAPTTTFGAQQQQAPMFGQQAQQPLGQTQLFGQPAQQQPLFGGAQPQAQGLFGQQPQQQTNLFGGTPQQNQIGLGATGQTAGLFGGGVLGGGAQPNLFGGQQQTKPAGLTTTPSGGTNLFGAQQPAAGGLFGATQQQPAAGGLFGATQQQPAGGTLFGQQPAGQNTLFGAKPLAAAGGTTLFGGASNPQPTLGQTPTTGMFGTLGQTQTAPVGNFTLQQQAPPGPQAPAFNPYMDPNQLADPYGKADYLPKVSPLDNADDDIKKIHEQVFSRSSGGRDDPYREFSSIEKLKRGTSSNSTPTQEEYLQPFDIQPAPTGFEQAFASVDQRVEKYAEAYKKKPGQPKVYNVERGYTKPMFNQFTQRKESFRTDSSFAISRQNSVTSYQAPYNEANVTPTIPKKYSEASMMQELYQQPDLFIAPTQSKQDPNVLQIEVEFPEHDEYTSHKEVVSIHRTRDAEDLYKKVREIMEKRGLWSEEIESIKLLHKNAMLPQHASLADCGITQNGRLTVIYEIRPKLQASKSAQKDTVARNPVLPPARGYKTSPAFEKLAAMSEGELQSVTNFSIWNEYGQITWEGFVDLTGVDLAKTVVIEEDGVTVYDDNVFTKGIDYPEVGQKLNRPATIELYHVDFENNVREDEGDFFEEILKSMNGGQHLLYDQDTKHWTFKVKHFTKYKIPKVNGKVVIPRTQPESMSIEPAACQGSSVINPAPMQIMPILSSSQQQAIPNFQRPILRSERLDSEAAMPPPSQRRRDLDSESQSVYSNMEELYQQQNQRMFVENSQPVQERTIDEVVQESTIKDKGEEIADRIRANDEKFRKARQLFGPKKSVQECLQYLKKENVPVNETADGLITGVKGVPNRVHRFRPQFRPDGALLTLKRTDNKLKITEIEVVSGAKNAEVKKSYQGLTDIILKHSTIIDRNSKGSKEQRNQTNSENEASQAPVRQEAHRSNFEGVMYMEDAFIERMLTTKNMPHVSFKKDPKDLFHFFDDVTTVLLAGLQRTKSPALTEKLNSEFHVVCILNALFGNPNIHLVQKHPAFKGLVNYPQAKERFANYTDGYNLMNEKKRKNALTEVLRFILQQDNKVSQDGDVYKIALDHLMNGAVRPAVDVLNHHGKTQMANHVINCFGNVNQKMALESWLVNESKTAQFKEDSGAAKMLSFMTGNLLKKPQHFTWMQALCYQLMVVSKNTDTLVDAISEFNSYMENLHQGDRQPLLWLLIKFYGLHEPETLKETLNQLQTFSNVQVFPRPNQDLQDHRVQYLVTLSLFNFLQYRTDNSIDYCLKNKERFIGSVITLNNLAQSSLLYAQQLMRENDWQQALLITAMIPDEFTKIKKHLTYNILQRKAYLFNPEQRFENAGEANPYIEFALIKLKLPKSYVFASRGLWHESVRQYERSIEDYVKAKNSAAAHSLFVKHVAHCYITGPLSVLSRSDNRGNLLSMLGLLSKNSGHIANWRSQGQLLQKVLQSLAGKGKVLYPECLARDLDYFSSSGNDSERYLQKVIWSLLLQVSANSNLDQVLSSLGQGRYPDRSVTPIHEEITSIYPTSPELSRFLEDFTVIAQPKIYSLSQKGEGFSSLEDQFMN